MRKVTVPPDASGVDFLLGIPDVGVTPETIEVTAPPRSETRRRRRRRDIIEREMVDLRWIEESIKRIQETMHIMRYNVNRWLVFENLLLHIMRHPGYGLPAP